MTNVHLHFWGASTSTKYNLLVLTFRGRGIGGALRRGGGLQVGGHQRRVQARLGLQLLDNHKCEFLLLLMLHKQKAVQTRIG